MAESLDEALIVVFPPYCKGSPGIQGFERLFDGPGAVKGIVLFIRFGMGSPVEIQDDGVKPVV